MIYFSQQLPSNSTSRTFTLPGANSDGTGQRFFVMTIRRDLGLETANDAFLLTFRQLLGDGSYNTLGTTTTAGAFGVAADPSQGVCSIVVTGPACGVEIGDGSR